MINDYSRVWKSLILIFSVVLAVYIVLKYTA